MAVASWFDVWFRGKSITNLPAKYKVDPYKFGYNSL